MNDELHNRAIETVDEARLLELRGSPEAAREKYEIAAALEEKCLEGMGDNKPRSLGILSVSAVSLWILAGNLDHAEQLVRRYVSSNIGAGFQRELFELLNDIRQKREEIRTIPVEPEERAAVVQDALRKAEADLAEGRVHLWAIRESIGDLRVL